MRSVALVALLALIAAPAFAVDGNVSASTLNSLGLSGMETVSDAQGMQVRGMASAFAMVKGTSLIFGQLVTPDTKNFVSFSSVNEVDGNVETTAVPFAINLAKTHAVAVNPPVVLTVTFPAGGTFSGVYTGSISGQVGGAGSIILP